MASKPIYIFSISRHYTRCEVFAATRWIGSLKHGCLQGRFVIAPDKGLTRRERYQIVAEWLFGRWGIPSPSYRPLKSEVG